MLLVKEALDIATGCSPELVNTIAEDIIYLSYEIKRNQAGSEVETCFLLDIFHVLWKSAVQADEKENSFIIFDPYETAS